MRTALESDQNKIEFGLTFVSVTINSSSLTASTVACSSTFDMIKLLPFSDAVPDFAITNLQIMSSCTTPLKYDSSLGYGWCVTKQV